MGQHEPVCQPRALRHPKLKLLSTTLHENRMLLINHMEDVLQRDLVSHYGSGRGIVLVAGNADTLRRVKWLLQMLRSYGSTLPVQIVSACSCASGSQLIVLVPLSFGTLTRG
jgi:hypothetical protein